MELLEQDFLPTIFSKMFSWTLQMDTESIDSVQLYAGLKVKAVQVNWVFYQQTQKTKSCQDDTSEKENEIQPFKKHGQGRHMK